MLHVLSVRMREGFWSYTCLFRDVEYTEQWWLMETTAPYLLCTSNSGLVSFSCFSYSYYMKCIDLYHAIHYSLIRSVILSVGVLDSIVICTAAFLNFLCFFFKCSEAFPFCSITEYISFVCFLSKMITMAVFHKMIM